MKKRLNFTLVELAVIVSIIAVFALIFSGCNNSKEKKEKEEMERAHRISCRNNLRQIGIAFELYAASNDGHLPAGPAFAGKELTEKDFYTASGRAGGFELLRTGDFLGDYKVYVCPSSSVEEGRSGDSLSWSKAGSGSGKPNLSYAYHPGMVNGDSIATGKPGSGVCADLTGDAGVDANDGKPNHTNFGNILYLDGHVQGYDGAGWFSPENAGYPNYKVGSKAAIFPNTLR